jgi:hypothetical protein
VIKFPSLEEFYTEDERAIMAKKPELLATRQRRQTELAEVDAAIAIQADTNPTPEDRIQNLIAGIETPRPQPLSEKRTELRYNIRDIEQALDFMAGQERRVIMIAGARLCKDIKPQVDAAAKKVAEAMATLFEVYVPWWQAKQYLINAGTGLNGLFDSNIVDILGAPVSKETPLADYLRGAVQSGHLQAVPAQLR